ncbi:MAG: methionine--tRNA ligase [Planctomycetes bacterium]|nr:methionine--tRNA ligase [Planctomycetota bacterium]
MSAPRRLLVTSALPYVNGHIHIGHLVEYLQTDIWVRFQRLVGNQCAYICADDTHGTATMIRARQESRSEADIIREMSKAHQDDFAAFDIRFDHYGSTDSASNRTLVGEFWSALRASGRVAEKEVTQLYDPKAGTFLADRFVRGTCPKCGAADQPGDNCDKCSATYAPTDLKDAVSTLSGAKPELRSAKHYFVRLELFRAFLETWVHSGTLQPEIAKWLQNTFLTDELRDWDVSRPAPYFGFEIPDAPGNYFYVWLDAPIGYIAATKDWCDAQRDDVARWWKDPACEVHHFIGKDIAYFHTLFWPAMLSATAYSLPKQVHIHGFLTVDGEKMSKSKGTFVRARTYLDHLDPAFLRYFYASKLTQKAEDLDLNLEEFAAKVNSDLVGKVVNLASRTARFIPAIAAAYPDDGGLFAAGAAESAAIAQAYDDGDFNQAMRRVMALADRANEYVEHVAPWALKKAAATDPAAATRLENACTVALNLFRQLAVYLAPVLPRLAEQAGTLLGAPITAWSDAQRPLTGHAIGNFARMLDRVDPAKVAAMVAASAQAEPAAPAKVPAATTSTAVPITVPAHEVELTVPLEEVEAETDSQALREEPLAETIDFAAFSQVDLRVAEVLTAEDVPKAKKIIKLTLGLGGSERRVVFAGIKSAYKPEQLVGRLIVFVANLEPRKMSFGISEGMALAAGLGEQDIFLLSPDSGAKPGMRIH